MITTTKAFNTDTTLAIFGYGDIGMCSYETALPDKHKCLVFKNMEPSEIGELVPNESLNINDLKPELCFVFNDNRSIDLLIDKLHELKSH